MTNELPFTNEDVYITPHARKRMRKRFGKYSSRLPLLAIERGMPGYKAKGKLYDYLNQHQYSHLQENGKTYLWVYQLFCFIFGDDGALITLFSIPKILKDIALEQLTTYQSYNQKLN